MRKGATVPRTFRERTGNCVRCGVEITRKVFKTPIMCGPCRQEVAWFERHPNVPDPVEWAYPTAKPGYTGTAEPAAAPAGMMTATWIAEQVEERNRSRARIGELQRKADAMSEQIRNLHDEREALIKSRAIVEADIAFERELLSEVFKKLDAVGWKSDDDNVS